MKSCSWSSYCTSFFCIDSLVSFTVKSLLPPFSKGGDGGISFYVWWEGNLTIFFKFFINITITFKYSLVSRYFTLQFTVSKYYLHRIWIAECGMRNYFPSIFRNLSQ